jgi:hypothetical protein
VFGVENIENKPPKVLAGLVLAAGGASGECIGGVCPTKLSASPSSEKQQDILHSLTGTNLQRFDQKGYPYPVWFGVPQLSDIKGDHPK